jgi:hypothetical protein
MLPSLFVVFMLQAAPLLTVLHASSDGSMDDVTRMLRGTAPFQPLRLTAVRAFAMADEDEADCVALGAALADHASLQDVGIFNAPLGTAAALDAIVHAALARSLPSLELYHSNLGPASAPALARLLGSAALTKLTLEGHNIHNYQLLDAGAAAVLGAALRANSTLTELELNDVGLWRDPAAAFALLASLVAHPSLETLCLAGNMVGPAHAACAGAALFALVAANAPALRCLKLERCGLGEAGLGPLLDALPRNGHLWSLDCPGNGPLSDAFARDRLLPAVRACTSLRALVTDEYPDDVRDAIFSAMEEARLAQYWWDSDSD